MQFIDLKAQQLAILPDGQTIRSAIDERVSAVMDHGQYILGPEVAELEQTLAEFVGVEHCIAVASGTDALLIALMALGVGPGDEVITTPFSFIATAETIALLGATPVFVDICAETYNINPDLIEPAINERTKAIVPVSLYGQPADFSAINAIASVHGIPVIEDGAQSFGSTHNSQKSCSLSTIGTTSFFPSKPFGCYGDAGACFTSDGDLAAKMRCISRHGQSKRYVHTDLGVNGRIDTIQAAVLLAKWPNFAWEVEQRSNIGASYSRKLEAAGVQQTPQLLAGNTSVYAQYTVQVPNRARIQAVLKEDGIPTAVHYPGLLCQQKALKSCGTRCSNVCSAPVALAASERVMSLPMHPWLSEFDQNRVVASLVKALQSPFPLSEAA